MADAALAELRRPPAREEEDFKLNLFTSKGFALAQRLTNSLGYRFRREGVMLDGKRFCETHYPDGTWMRTEHGPEGTVCEWTDELGACNRIVTAPVRHRAR